MEKPAEVELKQEDELVIVSILVPPETKKKEVEVKFTDTSVKVSLKDKSPLIQGNLKYPINGTGSMWQLEGKK